MSRGLVLLGLVIFLGFYAFFMLADYGWEKRKRSGLDTQARAGRWSEAREYEWYSWIRYLAVILLTFLNAAAVIDSDREHGEVIESPMRMLLLTGIPVLFSIALLTIDGYWERCHAHGRKLNGAQTAVFWSYFWLRYPALILVTIQLVRRGLRT